MTDTDEDLANERFAEELEVGFNVAIMDWINLTNVIERYEAEGFLDNKQKKLLAAVNKAIKEYDRGRKGN